MMLENTQPFDSLLVEDEPADVNLVRAIPKENEVFPCREGEINSAAPQPAPKFLDLGMPDGREFLPVVEFDAAPAVVPTASNVQCHGLAPCYELESCMERIERSQAHQSRTMRLLPPAHSMLERENDSRPNPEPVNMEQFIAAIRQIDCHCFILTRLPRKN